VKTEKNTGTIAFRFRQVLLYYVRWKSSVSIETGYEPDSPGIESQWGRDYLYLSRLALGPTQLPIKWVPGLYVG
jgi:hypothetical protein